MNIFSLRRIKGCCVAIRGSHRRDGVTDPPLAPNSSLEARGAFGKQWSRTMIRERVLTISTILALAALSSAAYAEPQVSGKAGPSSQSRQSEPDWYRARAMQQGAPPAQIVREGTSSQIGCRYLYSGGPKSPASC
jgi:hypothetical protein